MYKGYSYHLTSLGLLAQTFELEQSNKLLGNVENKINTSNYQITEFGRMIIELLKE